MLSELIEVLQQLKQHEAIAKVEEEVSEMVHQLAMKYMQDKDFEKVTTITSILKTATPTKPKTHPKAEPKPKPRTVPFPVLTDIHCELAVLESLSNHVQLKRVEIFQRSREFLKANHLLGAAEEQRHIIFHRHNNTRTEGRYIWEEMLDKSVGRLVKRECLQYIVSESNPVRNRSIEITEAGVEYLKALRQQFDISTSATTNGNTPLLQIEQWCADKSQLS